MARKREYTREWCRNLSTEKRLLYAARRRAKLNGLECSIQESDILVPEECPILGIKLKRGKSKQTGASPSLDRIDNSKGYTPDNIAVISYKANACKNTMTVEQIKRLHEYVLGLGQTH